MTQQWKQVRVIVQSHRQRPEQQKRLEVIHFQWELATRSVWRCGSSDRRDASIQSNEKSWEKLNFMQMSGVGAEAAAYCRPGFEWRLSLHHSTVCLGCYGDDNGGEANCCSLWFSGALCPKSLQHKVRSMMNGLENWRYAAYNHNSTTNLILVTTKRDVCSIA